MPVGMYLLEANKTVQIVTEGNSEVVGYVFASTETVEDTNTSQPVEVQVQRWVLREEFPPLRGRTLLEKGILLRVPNDDWESVDTAAEFVKKVRNAWKTGWRYVKVNCLSHANDTSPSLPRPPPPAPEVSTESQSDIGTLEVRIGVSTRGFVWTDSLGTGWSIEHWILSEDYRPPSSGSTEVTVRLGDMNVAERFISLINGDWKGANFSYMIAFCNYYEGVPDPG